MSCWYRTNIFFENAITEYGKREIKKLQDIAAEEGIMFKRFLLDEEEFLSREWLEGFHDKGLYATSVMVFCRAPHFQPGEAHIDGGRVRQPYMALNYVPGDDDSEMIWYEIPKDVPALREDYAGTVSHSFPTDTLTEMERACIGNSDFLSLVRTDVPHDIIMGDNPRTVISIRFWDDYDSWEDVCEQLKEFIVE